jgi:iron(III) transport system ATP-binding protein
MRELVKRLGITTLYVTHDQLEALTMSDVVAVMSDGRIIQEGSPIEIYQTPRERFVANFIGLANFIEGKIKAVDLDGKGVGRVETSSGVLACRTPEGLSVGDKVIIVVRPEDVNLVNSSSASEENVLAAKVKAVIFMGDALECTATIGEQQLRMKLHPSSGVREGSTVHFQIPPKYCRVLQA